MIMVSLIIYAHLVVMKMSRDLDQIYVTPCKPDSVFCQTYSMLFMSLVRGFRTIILHEILLSASCLKVAAR